MFSIFSSSVPQWAKFLTSKEYKTFMSLVDKYFTSKDLRYTHNDGAIVLPKSANNQFGSEQLGLVNLAQRCKLAHDGDWTEIIRDHFEGLAKAHEFNVEFDKRKNDFLYAKQFLGVKLYDESYFDAVGLENVIHKRFADAIIEVLIFDFPHSVTSIKPEQASGWNVSVDELFAIGFKNITQRYAPEISKENFGDFDIWFCQSNHLFATNLALDKEAMKKYTGSNGSLVGLPHRHAMLIYPIENLGVVSAINKLIPVIAGMNNEGPGSISPKLFWYVNDSYVNLPYELGEKKLSFKPPIEFVNMINTLK